MADQLYRTPFRKSLEAGGRAVFSDFMELFTPSVVRWEDDFQGDLFFGGAAPGVYQSTASGTSSAVAAIVAGTVNGVIRLDPGTDSGGRSDLSLGLHYQGDHNAVCIWEVLMPSSIGSFKFELGFTDVISGTDAGAVATKATPTFNATDCAVLVFDTNDDTNLSLVSAKAGTAATVIDFSTALAAATSYYLAVALQDDRAKGFLYNANGGLIEETAWQEDAVTETVAMTPWAFVQNRSGAQRLLDIDYLLAYQRRTTAS